MNFPEEWDVYEVGGFVRDHYLGVESKDIDFAVQGPKSLEGLRTRLIDMGFDVFKVDEATFTVRARFPRFPKNSNRYDGLAADFVLCRREGPYSDGRHPDWVKIGTIYDDLARRDFTVNAIARPVGLESNPLDPHGGLIDIKSRTLRFVGDPQERIVEDALRVVRGLRFMVTKDFTPAIATWLAMTSGPTAKLLEANIPIERVRDELHLMFRHNTSESVKLLVHLPLWTHKAIVRDGLWLEPSLKGRK